MKLLYSKLVMENFKLKINGYTLGMGIRPRGYKTFFTLNSIEHGIFPAHKC